MNEAFLCKMILKKNMNELTEHNLFIEKKIIILVSHVFNFIKGV